MNQQDLAAQYNIPAEFVQKKQSTDYPTEIIDLPSGGKFYPSDNPLSTGRIELKYPTAREEDILTSKNLITKGVVIDKFMESLIVDPSIKLDSIVLGDKNAILVASRILAYGPMYDITTTCPKCGNVASDKIDLSQLQSKEAPDAPNGNDFTFTLPVRKNVIRFKVLTAGHEKAIDMEMRAYKKYAKDINQDTVDPEITTRLKYAITSVDDNNDPSVIKKTVDSMLSRDSLALRQEISRVSPDVDMRYTFQCKECDHEERMGVPLNVNFFWPSGNVQD